VPQAEEGSPGVRAFFSFEKRSSDPTHLRPGERDPVVEVTPHPPRRGIRRTRYRGTPADRDQLTSRDHYRCARAPESRFGDHFHISRTCSHSGLQILRWSPERHGSRFEDHSMISEDHAKTFKTSFDNLRNIIRWCFENHSMIFGVAWTALW